MNWWPESSGGWPIRGQCCCEVQGAGDLGACSAPVYSLGKCTGATKECSDSSPGSYVIVGLRLDVSEESTFSPGIKGSRL